MSQNLKYYYGKYTRSFNLNIGFTGLPKVDIYGMEGKRHTIEADGIFYTNKLNLEIDSPYYKEWNLQKRLILLKIINIKDVSGDFQKYELEVDTLDIPSSYTVILGGVKFTGSGTVIGDADASNGTYGMDFSLTDASQLTLHDPEIKVSVQIKDSNDNIVFNNDLVFVKNIASFTFNINSNNVGLGKYAYHYSSFKPEHRFRLYDDRTTYLHNDLHLIKVAGF
jgi:hypothetical protein